MAQQFYFLHNKFQLNVYTLVTGEKQKNQLSLIKDEKKVSNSAGVKDWGFCSCQLQSKGQHCTAQDPVAATQRGTHRALGCAPTTSFSPPGCGEQGVPATPKLERISRYSAPPPKSPSYLQKEPTKFAAGGAIGSPTFPFPVVLQLNLACQQLPLSCLGA